MLFFHVILSFQAKHKALEERCAVLEEENKQLQEKLEKNSGGISSTPNSRPRKRNVRWGAQFSAATIAPETSEAPSRKRKGRPQNACTGNNVPRTRDRRSVNQVKRRRGCLVHWGHVPA